MKKTYSINTAIARFETIFFPGYLTIIPWARVGYELVNSQRGANHRVGYNLSHIQQARME